MGNCFSSEDRNPDPEARPGDPLGPVQAWIDQLDGVTHYLGGAGLLKPWQWSPFHVTTVAVPRGLARLIGAVRSAPATITATGRSGPPPWAARLQARLHADATRIEYTHHKWQNVTGGRGGAKGDRDAWLAAWEGAVPPEGGRPRDGVRDALIELKGWLRRRRAPPEEAPANVVLLPAGELSVAWSLFDALVKRIHAAVEDCCDEFEE